MSKWMTKQYKNCNFITSKKQKSIIMKICAVVILYNPEEIGLESVIRNINSYAEYMRKIYIIDNSSSEHAEIAEKLKNTVYFSNKNKGGIGGAQNIGLKQACEDGFEWAMTMDQDTIFESEQIKSYIQKFNDFLEKDINIASFSLRAENITNTFHWIEIPKKLLRPLKRAVFGKKKLPPSVTFPPRCIASANIIKTSVWSTVGGFNEFFFIDQVDYEFCYKIIEKGFKIIKFNDIYMNQHFGEAHGFTLFRKRYPKYSSLRYYYCIRNSFIIKRLYPQYKSYHEEYIRDLFFDNCINSIHPLKNFQIFFKAYKDSKKF